MTGFTLHGEISAEGDRVVVIAAGDPHELIKAAQQLVKCTPLMDAVDGVLCFPLTWMGVAQLAWTYGSRWKPGPRLAAWIREQLVLRTTYLDREWRYQIPKGLKPYWWQTEGAKMIAHLGGLETDDPGLGKALRDDQPVLTPGGWTAIGKLNVGDCVVGSDGRFVRVTGVYPQGIRPLFAVTTNDRITVVADADHLWVTQTSYDRRRHPERWGVRTTAEIVETLTVPEGAKRRTNHYLPMLSAPVGGPVIDELLDPWLVGVLIGDGGLTSGSVMLTNPDTVLIERVRYVLPEGVTLEPAVRSNLDGIQWRISSGYGTGGNGAGNPVIDALRDLGLYGCHSYEKSIPDVFMHASARQRYALLTGLLDTDGGTNSDNTVEYSTSSAMLAEQVAWLVQSLGGTVRVYRRFAPTYTHNGERRVGRPAWRLNINLPWEFPPFVYSVKATRYAEGTRTRVKRPPMRQIVSIIPVAPGNATCISVDAPNRLYVTAGCVLTHNSATAILGLCERSCWGHKVWPAIVVCPPSVVDSWVRHWQQWAPHVKAVAWRGTPAKRVELIGRYQVYVTGYALTRNDAAAGMPLKSSPLMRIKANTVICDESHNVRNHEALQTRATRRLGRAAKLFIPMSGTPFEHNFAELQPVLDTMLPGACPSKERLASRWCSEVSGDYSSTVVGLNPEREPELRMALLGQVVGRRKKDVLKDLPPKIYSVREVELPPVYRKIYNDMERRMLAELEDGTELTVMGVLAKLTRLQQLSTAACDVEVVQREDRRTGELKDHQVVHPRLPSWKIDALIEVLDERAGVHPVLAFAPSRQLIVLAGEVAAKAGYRVGYVIGGQKPAERTGCIDAFQAGQLDLMCATIEAGGEGLTLTAAGTNVFLQRSVRLIRHLQSEDRSWGRVDGSEKKSVEIIDIWAKNTVDARIKQLLLTKAGQLGEFLQDPRLVRTLFGGEEAEEAA